MAAISDFFKRLFATPRGRWAFAGVVAAVLAISVGALAIFGGGDDPIPGAGGTTSPPTASSDMTEVTQTPPSATIPATSVTATTIVTPGLSLSLEDAPEGFDQSVAALYRWVAGLDPEPPGGPPQGLIDHLADAEPVESLDLSGAVSWAALRDRGRVAVARIDDDVVLGVDDGGGWIVVGAKLPRFDKTAWYGADPRTVLVIGADADWTQNIFRANGDSIQILTAAADGSGGAIIGIPRDSWVEQPAGSFNKFTSVLAGGGPEAMLEAARRLTGLDIEGYLITGYLGFEQVARGFGPITIDLPEPVRGGTDPGGTPGFPDFAAGTQMPSPEDLLLYLRIRKTLPNGDFDRVANAGMVTLNVLDLAIDRGIEQLPLLLSILAQSTHNDMSTTQLLTLGATAFELDPAEVERVVVPGTVGTIGQASVVNLDPGAAVIFADVSDGLLNGG